MKKAKWGGEQPQDPNQVQIINDAGNANGVNFDFLENRMFFYSDINEMSILQFNRKLREMGGALLAKSIYLEIPTIPMYLHINSPGGSIFDGLSAMDEIINCKVPVISIVDGISASAATFLSVVAHKRLIKKHSFMLIHQLSSAHWGTYENFSDEKQNLDKLMGVIKSVYKNYSKIPVKVISEILKHDLYLDSKECLQYGLVDEII